MPIYKCDICNYTAKTKSNLNKHLKTKNHKQNEIIFNTSKNNLVKVRQETGKKQDQSNNINKKYECIYCKLKFTRGNNVSLHLKTCSAKKKYDEENELKNQLKSKDKVIESKDKVIESKDKVIESKDKEIINYKKEIENNKENYKEKEEHYKKEIEYYRKLLENAGNILLQKSISTINYVSNSYNTAPKIEILEGNKIKLLENNHNKLIELIMYNHNHKKLNKFIGNYIITAYKKKNPEKQSLWNTDSSRLTFVIKELITNKSSKWKVDKKGVKTKKYLINPTLEYIKKMLENENISLINKMEDTYRNNLEEIIEKVRIIADINKNIKDGILSNEILKFISPHFYFDDKFKKIKLIE